MNRLLRFLFLLLFIGNSFVSHAASGGPDAYGYIWRDSNEPNGPVYNWIDITQLPSTFEVKLLSDDNNRGPFSIGFNFPFYWYSVNTFWVGSNGYVGFTPTVMASPFPQIPSTVAPNDFLAVMSSDLNFDADTNAKCFFWKSNDLDTLVITWENVPFWTSTAPNGIGLNTFQAILSMVDSSITYQYKVQQGTSFGLSQFMTIGIENNSGNIGLSHSYDQYPPVNYAIKYYYPSNSTFQVSDASTVWNDNTNTGAIFLNKASVGRPLKTQIKNTGNQNLNPFNVFSRVLNSSNTAVVVNTQQSNTLTPGQTQTITHTNTFVPSNTGTYRFITDTQLSGDATPSNNSKTQEVVVIDTTLSPQVELSYCDNTNEGAGISWAGGNAGTGVYFEPPFTPFKIHKLSYYIVANPNLTGFRAQVLQSDGLPGLTATMIIDTLVDSNLVSPGSWNEVFLPEPIVVDDTAIFVSWMMMGDGIALGQDITPPFSFHCYEVLANSWAEYRSNTLEDLMIRVTVSPVPDTSSSGSSLYENAFTNPHYTLFPNPASSSCFISWNGEGDAPAWLTLTDLSGRTILQRNWNSSSGRQCILDLSSIPAGMYLVNVHSNGTTKTLRLVNE